MDKHLINKCVMSFDISGDAVVCLGFPIKWSRSAVSNSLRPHGLQSYQVPPPKGFSRQEYCSGLPFPSPGDLPDPGTEPRSPALQADALPSEPPGKSGFPIHNKTELCSKECFCSIHVTVSEKNSYSFDSEC